MITCFFIRFMDVPVSTTLVNSFKQQRAYNAKSEVGREVPAVGYQSLFCLLMSPLLHISMQSS